MAWLASPFFLKFRHQASDFVTNCRVHAFEPLSSRKANRGGAVRHCRSIKGHDDVDRMGDADTLPCFLLRGSSRLLRYLLGCFATFPFAFCSCLFIFCFRPLSLSFLPLSPIAYLLFPLSLIFSPRGCGCLVSSVFAYFHEHSCLVNNDYTAIHGF